MLVIPQTHSAQFVLQQRLNQQTVKETEEKLNTSMNRDTWKNWIFQYNRDTCTLTDRCNSNFTDSSYCATVLEATVLANKNNYYSIRTSVLSDKSNRYITGTNTVLKGL